MTDWRIPFVASKLLKHVNNLASRPKRAGEAGITEIRRRAYVLLLLCHEANEPPPEELLSLVRACLGLADRDVSTGATKKHPEAWWRAVDFESHQNIADYNLLSSKSDHIIARHAFPDAGDHRKTIAKWRAAPDYRWAVATLKQVRQTYGVDFASVLKRLGPGGINPFPLLLGIPE